MVGIKACSMGGLILISYSSFQSQVFAIAPVYLVKQTYPKSKHTCPFTRLCYFIYTSARPFHQTLHTSRRYTTHLTFCITAHSSCRLNITPTPLLPILSICPKRRATHLTQPTQPINMALTVASRLHRPKLPRVSPQVPVSHLTTLPPRLAAMRAVPRNMTPHQLANRASTCSTT